MTSKIIKAGTKTPRMPRYLVYGRSKQGKTTFACTAPNVLVLDPESGTREGASVALLRKRSTPKCCYVTWFGLSLP